MRAALYILASLAAVASAKNGRRKNGNKNGGGASSSLTLLKELVQENSSRNGLNASNPAQVASLTSTNNFINFCAGQTITNGQQVVEGSCNGIVMGQIPSKKNMVGAKFQFPKNFDTVDPFQDFEVKLAIKGIQTGFFANPNTNYYAAPQQVNQDGRIIGHTHIVINKLSSFQDTTIADPTTFDFFKGIDPVAKNGISTVVVAKGLAPGAYKLCSINTAANHQPVLMPVAQHLSVDDCVYFTVRDQKKGKNGRRHHHGRAIGGEHA
jgi:hypothetical protein